MWEWIQATHHVTDAETFGWSFVHGVAMGDVNYAEYQSAVNLPWWLKVCVCSRARSECLL